MNPSLTNAVRFAEAASASDASGVRSEDRERLFFTANFDETLAAQCTEVANELEGARLAKVEVTKQNVAVASQDVADVRGLVRVTFVKQPLSATASFFTVDGLAATLERDRSMDDVSTVLIAADFPAFSSWTATYQTWDHVIADGDPARHAEDDPRKYVLDRENLIPAHVGPLLPKDGALPQPSAVSDVWMLRSQKMLPLLFCDEISRGSQGDLMLIFATPRTMITYANNEPLNRASAELCIEAAAWVYDGAVGTQSRHNFYAAELARMWTPGEDWSTGFQRVGSRALESAKSAQRLHESGKTSDVLKAEGDLRKALNDEVTRVNQQIRDLTAALWRDFAVALGAVVAKATLTRAGASAASLTPAVVVAAAAFLLVSGIVVIYANRRLLTIARDARSTWQRDVYAFLAAPQVESLALKPISAAENVYFRIETVVIVLYIVGIAALVAIACGVNVAGFAGSLLGSPSPSPSPSP